jgi:poly(A) polymerase
LLRCATGEQNPALGQWWTDFIAADPSAQEALLASVKNEVGAASKTAAKRRRRRKPKATSATTASPEPTAG